MSGIEEPTPSYFWCTRHRLPHSTDSVEYLNGGRFCSLVGPYATREEAVEWGVAAQ